MNFYSPYKHMVDAAAAITDKQNARLFIRHSIRYDNPINGDFAPLMLTPEGIELAKKMGASLDRPVGECQASKIKRCPQTIKCICEGMDKKYCPSMPEIKEYSSLYGILGNPMPVTMGGVGWYEYYHYLQEGNFEATRGITLDMEAKSILDTIFLTKGEPGTVDLICSHDSHVVVLASALFDYKTGLNGENWCQYAEGIWLTGDRNDFTAMWRGETNRFVNYLI